MSQMESAITGPNSNASTMQAIAHESTQGKAESPKTIPIMKHHEIRGGKNGKGKRDNAIRRANSNSLAVHSKTSRKALSISPLKLQLSNLLDHECLLRSPIRLNAFSVLMNPAIPLSNAQL